MKFIVTVATVAIEASTHKEAVEKAVEQLRADGVARVSVCDMEIGVREHYDVRFEKNEQSG